MKIFISKDGKLVHEYRGVDELHISRCKNVVITYLDIITKPFSKDINALDWDTIIINKKTSQGG